MQRGEGREGRVVRVRSGVRGCGLGDGRRAAAHDGRGGRWARVVTLLVDGTRFWPPHTYAAHSAAQVPGSALPAASDSTEVVSI